MHLLTVSYQLLVLQTITHLSGWLVLLGRGRSTASEWKKIRWKIPPLFSAEYRQGLVP